MATSLPAFGTSSGEAPDSRRDERRSLSAGTKASAIVPRATAALDGPAPRPTTCQMFETPLIERFSRIHPSTPFLFWLPVLAYLGYHGLQNGVPPAAAAGEVVAGVLVWTLAEYLLHRYLFHYSGPSPWQQRLHFIIHGVHHDFPQDSDRLVMPLGASVPLGVPFYLAFRLLFGVHAAGLIFVGFGLGYLAYDGTHYAIHHFRMSSRYGRWIKKHHMVHHHTGVDARWGVSTPLWDWVFRTLGSR